MSKRKILCALAMGLVAVVAWGGPDHDMAPITGSNELERVKKLAGHWNGTSTDMSPDNKPQKVTVDYRVTSNGSVVVETLCAGTPHEMVSVYHDLGGKLAMTHYCSMGNQPRMRLTNSTPSEISLSLEKNGDVDAKSPHMHAITLVTSDPDHLVQKWTSFENGKEKATSTFTYSKKG